MSADVGGPLVFGLLFVLAIVGLFFLLVPKLITFVFAQGVSGIVVGIGYLMGSDKIFVIGTAGCICFFTIALIGLFPRKKR